MPRTTALGLALPVALLLASLALPGCAKRMDSHAPGYAEGGMAADGAPSASAPIAAEAEVAAEADADGAIAAKKSAPIAASRLTAGTFDDALNPGLLRDFAARYAAAPDFAALVQAMTEVPTIVTVVDEGGRPVHGARVQGLPTGTDGRVVLFHRNLGPVRDGASITVEHAGRRVAAVVVPGDDKAVVQLQGASAPPRALDLALVIDATGSMGDELRYLTAELGGIVDEMAAAFPGIDQRWALVVYRDEGDHYVSRRFDFETRLRSFQRSLAQQQADGGGDYPEAMDRGLQDAASLSWRGDEAAKVLFLIADAPPHSDAIARTMGAVDELQAEGVGIYPVAASGVAEEAELVMRAAALQTGGQYLFLTDDSGIGDAHAEPHIPCYAVETLRDAMARMIVSELRGQRVEADPRRQIRSVGRSQGGVCERPGAADQLASELP
ncbi:MAG: VWA domain-containing protein [Nannocystaceae bacterium]